VLVILKKDIIMKNKKNEKRRYFSKEKALEMINECGLEIFQAYRDGLERFNEEIQQTNPMCRTRLESTLLNAKMAESFMDKGQVWKIAF
jgi:uncharacterized lipoprotein NlpE involved in copper resistance